MGGAEAALKDQYLSAGSVYEGLLGIEGREKKYGVGIAV